ncbi:MAG TPA: DUF5009 domain-containing protein [Longimicrobiales bacterium]
MRLVSLDAFRGITIAGMLLVNNPGSWTHIYPPLRHASWHGWTPTDLIFPYFLFIVGTAMVLSFSRLQEQGASRAQLLRKAGKRALLIFLIGLVLHSFPWIGYDFAHLRIPGVLQRIALVYISAAIIFLMLPSLNARVLAIAILLFGYWALQTLVPVPGGEPGVLLPGKDLGSFIDRALLTPDHLWRETKGQWDPEGLLSTVPAIATALLGACAGLWLITGRTPLAKAKGLLIAGIVATIAGMLWGMVFPINKSLWTSSYVIFTAGTASLLLALCYWLIDVRRHQRWAKPFVIFGMNALAAFFLSSLFARVLTWIKVGADDVALKTVIYRNLFTPFATPLNASLAFAITYVLFWLAVMALFYRRKIFIKL